MSGIISGEAQAISLYLVNQLRHAPQTWATMLDVDLYKDYAGATVNYDASPKDSLTYDALLQKTAGDYSIVLAAKGNIDHHYAGIGPVDDKGWTYPWTRAAAEGYTGSGVSENLAYNMVKNSSLSTMTGEQMSCMLVEQLFIDDGVSGLGHRINYLASNHSEVGFGFSTGSNPIYSEGKNVYTTENYGIDETAATTPHLTGFVLQNSDGNLQYNAGEGISGVTITVTDNTDPSKSTTVVSQDYGYWDFAASAGHSYTVSASGGSFSGTATAVNVVVDTGGTNGYNTRTIDFFSGDSSARVDYGVPTNHAVTGTVTISGPAVVGATLRADTSALFDADGLGSFSYRWFVDGVEIKDTIFENGSVSSTSGSLLLGEELAPDVVLALTQSASTPGMGDWLVGHTFSVVVTYTDQSGTLEAVKSAETSAVNDMTVSEALSSLGNDDYREISITDTGSHLLNLANTLALAADLAPYHKIREFHLSDEATADVSEATALYLSMYKVYTWNSGFYYGYWLGGGHLKVSDTIENIASAAGNSSLAMRYMATSVEATGGTVSVADLAAALNNYTLTLKSGGVLTLTGTLSSLSSGDAAKVLAFIDDHVAPDFVGATITDGSKTLVLTYDEVLDSGSIPDAGSFDVTVNSVHGTPFSVAVSGKALLLTLHAAVAAGDSVTVAYSVPGSGVLQDIAGNDASTLPATTVAVQAVPPICQGASTNAAGDRIILTYDHELGVTAPLFDSFSVGVYDSGTGSISLPHRVVSVGIDGKTVELTLDSPINNGRDIVELTYSEPTTGDDTHAIQGISGSDAASFSNMTVTNIIALTPAIFGTQGNDTLNGGDGSDEIYAHTGSDIVSGGGGNDILDAGFHANGSTRLQLPEFASNTVSGGAGNDEIYGTNAADLLSGDAGNDLLYAGNGDDTLTGGAGNDYVDGGGGSGDTAVFSLERWKYTVTLSGSTYTVTDRSGADGADKVVNVETFRFADGDVAVADILNVNVGNHAPTGSIAITGSLKSGQTLGVDTASLADADGLPDAGSFTYQWKADGVPINGATQGSYMLTADEVGKVMTVTVNYTDLLGATESIASTGTPAVEASRVLTSNLIGMVSFWRDGSRMISGVDFDLRDNSTSVAHGTVGADGRFTQDSIPQGTYGLTVTKTTGPSDSSVTSAIKAADALAALKIAVGINPNADSSAVTPYQYLAADVNKDHKITAADALGILKMAVKLSSAPGFEWLLVPDSVGSLDMSRTSVMLPNGVTTSSFSLTLDQNKEVHLVGILLGDVNGSWA